MTNDEVEQARVKLAEQIGMRVGARLILMATYNVSSYERGGMAGDPSIADFLREVNPLVESEYIAEKCAMWRRSPTSLISSFDRDRLSAFIDWCDRRWGDECRNRVAMN